MQRVNEAIFVTAADAAFTRNLHQLFRGAERQGWTKNAHWIAYDMDMTEDQRARLQERFPWVELRKFDLENAPAHFVPSYGSYGWKGPVVWDVVKDADCPVIWMDSANLPKRDPAPMLDWVREHGFYILRGQTNLLGRCDRRMLEGLNVPRWIWGSRELATTVVGIDARRQDMRDIVEEWAKRSENEDMVRPPVDTFEGHKNDQALLSTIVQPMSSTGQLRLPEEDIDISSGRPIRFMSSRNKLRQSFPEWADVFARVYYAIWKTVDQALIRKELWMERRWFLRHMRRERYEIGMGDAKGGALHAPFWHSYRQPVLWEENENRWMLFQDFHYPSMRAVIAARPVDVPGEPVIALDSGEHTGHPNLFRHGGETWMVPETRDETGVDLYRATAFPNGWEHHRHIPLGANAAASVVFEHEGRWWMITSLQSPMPQGDNRYLAIFHTDDPIDGEWQAHPANVDGIGIEDRFLTGQNAGAVFEWEGQLIRCVQASSDYPGQGMEFRRMILTTESFAEERIDTPPHLMLCEAEGVHHLAQLGAQLAVGQRTRH